MATITVRDLPEDVRAALKRRAALNHRSMEAEVRTILTDTVLDVGWMQTLIAVAEDYRDSGGLDLEVPDRELPRPVELP